jgi:hypothetical protein
MFGNNKDLTLLSIWYRLFLDLGDGLFIEVLRELVSVVDVLYSNQVILIDNHEDCKVRQFR